MATVSREGTVTRDSDTGGPVLVIPAAGRGSRLGSDLPKALFPVAGRPMIDHLLDLYEPHVRRCVLVVAPEARAAISEHCRDHPLEVECRVQPEPTGMLDALLVPVARIRELRPAAVWVTWCDQVAVRPETVAALAATADRARQDAAGPPHLVLPTVRQRPPYIHLVRDRSGEIVDVLHRREGDRMPPEGESDMGLFRLSRRAYAELLPAYATEAPVGAGTGERNFLPFIPWLARRGRVVSFPASAEIEALGVNTPEDARRIERHLGR